MVSSTSFFTASRKVWTWRAVADEDTSFLSVCARATWIECTTLLGFNATSCEMFHCEQWCAHSQCGCDVVWKSLVRCYTAARCTTDTVLTPCSHRDVAQSEVGPIVTQHFESHAVC